MYHLSVKPISRSNGRTATAAAAYRAGAEIADLRTGEQHDYTRKRDIVHSEILLPAGSPAWAQDRAALWNAAEAAEKRKDARVARDYEVAIPKELTPAQGIALVRDFAQALVDRHGVAIDLNIHRDALRHWDGSDKGYQGYHAHLLASTRQLGREGFGAKAQIELSDTKRKSLGLSDGATEIERIRQLWEVTANRHLEQAHQAQRIDRRSLKDQGIDREPTVHLGPGVTALERDGIPSRLGDINRQVVAERHLDAQQRHQLSVLQPQIERLEREVAPARAKPAEVGRQVARQVERQVERPIDPPIDPRKGDTRPVSEAEFKAIRAFIDAAITQALDKLARERDLRVQRVLDKAHKRQERRDQAYGAIIKAVPAAPKGLLASFQQKGHQQALLVWQASKDAAAQLVEQAKRLSARLLQASGAQRLRDWAQEKLKRLQPELVARRDWLVRESATRSATESATRSQSPAQQKRLQFEPEPPELEPLARAPFRAEAGSDPRTLARSAGNARQPDRPDPAATPPEPPPKDIKTQAAEGVAAFRARLAKDRQVKPEKTQGDRMLERLKAQVEAEHKAAEQERSRQRERDLGLSRGHGRGRDGPEMGD